MKTIKILFIILLIGTISILIFFHVALSGTTWGGWTPPSTEFELTKKELDWKNKIEKNYDCKIDFIGLDSDFQEDSIIYINVIYKDNSNLRKILNLDIENVTKKLSTSFINSNKKKRHQSQILIKYIYNHNYNNDTILLNIPNERECLYNVKDSSIYPTNKKLIIPKFGYFDFYEIENDLFYYKLGGGKNVYFNCSIQDSTLQKYFILQKLLKYKELENCESYISKTPYKIKLNDGFIESIHNYTFFEDKCVSVKINYKFYSGKIKTRPIDFIKKVTEISPLRLKNSKKDNIDLIEKLKASNYNYDKNLFDVNIKFKVDSLKNPWTINYETSLIKFQYYKYYEK